MIREYAAHHNCDNPSVKFYKENRSNELRKNWIESGGRNHYYDLLQKLKLYEPNVNLQELPETSWLLSVDFTLTSPYTSQDDNPFYILDNPLCREWVFKVPYIAPSQWKGMLRASLSYRLAEEAEQITPQEFAERRFLLTELFGNEKGDDAGNSNLAGFFNEACKEAIVAYRELLKKRYDLKLDQETPAGKGNLYFSPTYFDIKKTGFEILNPQDRTTGSGKVPFHLETVPTGTGGRVTVLYVPLYVLPGADMAQNAVESLKLVVQGLTDLFTYYGLGAKTSSGFGTVNTKGILGLLSTVSINEKESIPEKYYQFFDKNGTILNKFLDSEGQFFTNKQYNEDETGIRPKLYKEFRYWYQEQEKNGLIKDGRFNYQKLGYIFDALEDMLKLPLKMSNNKGGIEHE